MTNGRRSQTRKVSKLAITKQWARRQNFWVLRCFAFWVRYPIQQLRLKAVEAKETANTIREEAGQYHKRHSIMEMEQEHLLKRCTNADNTVTAVRAELYERESTISRMEKMLQQKQLVETSLRTEISRRDLIEAEWHSEFGKRPDIAELGAVFDPLSLMFSTMNRLSLLVNSFSVACGTAGGLERHGQAQFQSHQELELRSAQAQIDRLKTELQSANHDKDSKLSSAFDIAASLRGMLQETLGAHSRALLWVGCLDILGRVLD